MALPVTTSAVGDGVGAVVGAAVGAIVGVDAEVVALDVGTEVDVDAVAAGYGVAAGASDGPAVEETADVAAGARDGRAVAVTLGADVTVAAGAQPASNRLMTMAAGHASRQARLRFGPFVIAGLQGR